MATKRQTKREILKQIDPSDLAFHAARYSSGEKLREVVEMAHDSESNDSEIEYQLSMAFEACKDDGSSWGFFPCLGGRIAELVDEAFNAPTYR